MLSGVKFKIALVLLLCFVVHVLASLQHPSVISDNSVHRYLRNAEHPIHNSASACASQPKISIVSYLRDGFFPNATFQTELINVPNNSGKDGLVILAPFEALVEIECEASEPITWSFDDPNVSI